jgi:hypothetical protein
MKHIVHILSLAIMALSTSGCATYALHQFGLQRETAAGFREMRITQDAYLLEYNAKVEKKDGNTTEARWVSIPISMVDDIIRLKQSNQYESVEVRDLNIHKGVFPKQTVLSSKRLPVHAVASVYNIADHLPVKTSAVCVSPDGGIWILRPLYGDKNDFVSCSIWPRATRYPALTYLVVYPCMPFAILYDALVVVPYIYIAGVDFK